MLRMTVGREERTTGVLRPKYGLRMTGGVVLAQKESAEQRLAQSFPWALYMRPTNAGSIFVAAFYPQPVPAS